MSVIGASSINHYLNILGWKRIDLVVKSHSQAFQFAKDFKFQWSKYKSEEFISSENSNIVILPQYVSNETMTQLLKFVKPYSMLLVQTQSQFKHLEPILQSTKHDNSFYLLIFNEDETISFDRCQTFIYNDFFVRDEIKLAPLGKGYSLNFDLQGAIMTSIDMTWMPYIKVENCFEKYFNCSVSAINGDLINILAEQFNFTLR